MSAFTGASDERVSLPNGPGAAAGTGTHLVASDNLGAMSYELSFDLPTGYPDATPELGLLYNSMAGNGVVGVGWDLPLPHIERATLRQGVPEYTESDTFTVNGAAELVSITPATGQARLYRRKQEGAFIRYHWHADREGRAGYWRAEHPDGSVAWFGAGPDEVPVPTARLEDASGRTFRYMLVLFQDAEGHRVRYAYDKPAGYPRLRSVEYLFPSESTTSRHQLRFEYQTRQDDIESALPGFVARLRSRLTHVSITTDGRLVRRYLLAYEDGASHPALHDGGTSRLVEVRQHGADGQPLETALRFGYAPAAGPECDDCERPFVYTMAGLGDAAGASGILHGRTTLIDINADALPDVLQTDGAAQRHRFFLNAFSEDGSGQAFLPAYDSHGAVGGFALEAPGVQVLDLDADGRTDMVWAAQHGVQALCNGGDGDWAQSTEAHCAPSLQGVLAWNFAGAESSSSAHNPQGVRFVDLDGDRRIDVLRTLSGPDQWLHNTPAGFVARPIEDLGRGFDQSGGGLQLGELNGDGLLDLVEIMPDANLAWSRVHLGHGQFAEAVSLPLEGNPAGALGAEYELQDLDGDGLDDLVLVRSDAVYISFNRAGWFQPFTKIGSADIVGELPTHSPSHSAVLFADMNASGSTDIVWFMPDGSVHVLELYPQRPNLLREIQNELGGVERIFYGSSAHQMADQKHHRLPQALTVVTARERHGGPSGPVWRESFRYHDGYYDGRERRFAGFSQVVVHTPASSYQEGSVTRLHYNVEDPSMRGLLVAEEYLAGTPQNARPIRSVSHHYTACPLGGVAHASPIRFMCERRTTTVQMEQQTEDVFRTLEIRRDYDGHGNLTALRDLGVVGTGPQGGGGCGPCDTPAGTFSGPCDRSGEARCLGDERYLEVEYVRFGPATSNRWMVNKPSRLRQGFSAHGRRRERLFFYDGTTASSGFPADFAPMAPGSLQHGRLTQVCDRVSRQFPQDSACETSDWIRTRRIAYNNHGQVVAELGPRGTPGDESGHLWTYRYSAERPHKLRTVSRFLQAPDGTPYQLTKQIAYHPTFDLPLSISEWQLSTLDAPERAAVTHLAYDAFGRLSAIARPGDDLSAPTQHFEYRLARPFSRVISTTHLYSQDTEDLEQVQCIDGFGHVAQIRTRRHAASYDVSDFQVSSALGLPVRRYQQHEGGAECLASAPDHVAFTSTRYDAEGRPLQITLPDARLHGSPSQVSFLYTPLQVTRFETAHGNDADTNLSAPSHLWVDGLGRPVAVARAQRQGGPYETVRALWNELGLLGGAVDPQGHVRRQEFDLLGRVLRVDAPNVGSLHFAYDEAGNMVLRTDARERSLARIYDGANRPVLDFDPASPENTTRRFVYDFLPECPGCEHHTAGRLAEVHYPLEEAASTGADSYHYDPRGQVASFTRSFARLRARVEIRASDGRGPGVAGRVGRAKKYRGISSSHNASSGVRDGPGGARISTRALSFTTHHRYDNAGRLTRRRYPDGNHEEIRYDGTGRVTQIPGVLPQVDHDARGLLQGVEYGNGTRQQYAYDAMQRLSELHILDASGRSLRGQTYSRDRSGNLLSLEASTDTEEQGLSPGPSATYEHDAFDRTTRVQYADGEELHIDFDSLDNITHKVSSRKSASAAHVGEYEYQQDSMSNAVSRAGSAEYRYDASGRMQSWGESRLKWDHWGHLRAASRGTQTAHYVYGPGHERVMETHSGATVYHAGPNFEVQDGIAVRYTRLGPDRVAKHRSDMTIHILPDHNENGTIDVGDAFLERNEEVDEATPFLHAASRRLLATAEPIRYLHPDHLGSLSWATDAQGSIVGERVFYPDGNLRAAHQFVDSYGFTGQRRDPTTGLLHFALRALDTRSARWIEPDPQFYVLSEGDLLDWGEATADYAYVGGRWTTHIDPTGLSAAPRRSQRTRRTIRGPHRLARLLVKTESGTLLANLTGGLQLVNFQLPRVGGVNVSLGANRTRRGTNPRVSAGFRLQLSEAFTLRASASLSSRPFLGLELSFRRGTVAWNALPTGVEATFNLRLRHTRTEGISLETSFAGAVAVLGLGSGAEAKFTRPLREGSAAANHLP